MSRPFRFRSRFRNHTATGLALILCLTATPGHAVWQWMRGAAATDFHKSDWALLQQTALEVLNDKPDREQVNWSNPETGNRGSIMALATFQFEGRKCRRAAMRNITVRGRDDRSAYTLCQQADGDWIFVPESTIRAAVESGTTGDGTADPVEATPADLTDPEP